jgi:hypothetical protein
MTIAANATNVQGNADTLTSDTGYPVKVGGVYHSSPPAPSSGQRVDMQMDAAGNVNVNVQNSVAGSFTTGSTSVGASAVEVTSSNIALYRGITIKAAAGNTGTIYVGPSSSVTAATNASTDGFELAAGDSITIPINNANVPYAIASAASQKVFWVAI